MASIRTGTASLKTTATSTIRRLPHSARSKRRATDDREPSPPPGGLSPLAVITLPLAHRDPCDAGTVDLVDV